MNKYYKNVDQIGGYILLSGFAETLETIPSLNAHMDCQLDYTVLKSLTKHRVSIISLDDEIVNSEISINLANKLETEKIFVENAGHFLERDGYKEFLDILPVLEKMN